MNFLTENQKNEIAYAIGNGRNCIFFRVPGFNNSIVLHFGETRDAEQGDVAHAMLHGFTIGGAVYAGNREGRWKHFSESVYYNSLEKGLSAYRSEVTRGAVSNSNIEQVVVVGKRYASIYMFGEASKKEIHYKNIYQISFDADKGISIVYNRGDKVVIYYIYKNMPQLAKLTAEIIEYTLGTLLS